MKTWALIGLLAGGSTTAAAQQNSDFLGWYGARLTGQPHRSAWSFESTYQYLTYQNASRHYVDFGAAYVAYRLPGAKYQLSAGYVRGRLDQLGRAHVVQARLLREFSASPLRPQWRLTLDRLWLQHPPPEAGSGTDIYRARWLVGVEPKLSEKLSLPINTEPFVYRGREWFREIRSQMGVRWQPARRLGFEAAYFNRWLGYSAARVSWEHAAVLTSTVRVGKL